MTRSPLPASPITDDLQFSPDRRTSNFSFSAVGSLVYQLTPPLPLYRLEWFDRQGAKLGSVGEPAAIESLAVSPDGRRALEQIAGGHESHRLWLLDLVRGVRSPFTPPGQLSLYPAWSPDGRQGACWESSPGVNRILVRSVDDPAQSRILLENPEAELEPTGWSPDGKTLLFNYVSTRSNQSDIALLAVDGKSAPRLVAVGVREVIATHLGPCEILAALGAGGMGGPPLTSLRFVSKLLA